MIKFQALWWPDRHKWLKHTRSTLDQVCSPYNFLNNFFFQIGVTAATYLEFTPMHKYIKYRGFIFSNASFIFRVQLPDFQQIDARLDFSSSVLKVTQELCRELSIRHPEELSLKRDIPADILRKGAQVESETQIQPYIKPGEV
jgi:hypothetical protein